MEKTACFKNHVPYFFSLSSWQVALALSLLPTHHKHRRLRPPLRNPRPPQVKGNMLVGIPETSSPTSSINRDAAIPTANLAPYSSSLPRKRPQKAMYPASAVSHPSKSLLFRECPIGSGRSRSVYSTSLISVCFARNPQP